MSTNFNMHSFSFNSSKQKIPWAEKTSSRPTKTREGLGVVCFTEAQNLDGLKFGEADTMSHIRWGSNYPVVDGG